MSEADRGIPVVLSPRDLAQAGVLDAALRPNAGVGLLAERRRNRPPGLLGESLTVYRPTLRERFGNAIYDGANAVGLGSIANRMRGEAQMAADFLPGVGDAIGAQEGAQAYANGDYLGAAAGGAGLIPVAGDLAGAGFKAMFLGVGAKTANRYALNHAYELEGAGWTPQEIWDETGWFKGADDQWRFEVDDSAATSNGEGALRARAAADGRSEYGPDDYATDFPLSEVMSHPELYRAYPDLAGAPTRLVSSDLGYQYKAGYEEGADRFHLSGPTTRRDDDFSIGHEAQHAIQAREGFARGGNLTPADTPELTAILDRKAALAKGGAWDRFDAWRNSPEGRKESSNWSYNEAVRNYLARNPDDVAFAEINRLGADEDVFRRAAADLYRRQAGEVEARNVQKRMNMTPEQRRAAAPWTTEDVPRDQQIVRRR